MITYLDQTPEEQPPAPPSSLGRKWAWRGKHRLNSAGQFVCGYKSWRQARDSIKVSEGGRFHRDSLANTTKGKLGQYERGTVPGTVCKHCGRLIESVVSHEEWLAYQAFREKFSSYGGGQARGYRGWFEPGAHGKSDGKRAWRGKHTGEGASFECHYITVVRPALRVKEEAGGCERCGRLRSEGQP